MVLTHHKSEARCFVLCLCLTAAAQLANAQPSSILSPIHLSLAKSQVSVAQVAEVSLASGDMALPVPRQAGTDQVLYLHLAGDTTRFGELRSIAATVLPSQEWIRQQRNLLFGQGIYAGIIVGLALYNLMLFLSIRERVYLFYVIYVLAFGAFWIARTGFFSLYLWPSHPLLDRQAQSFLAVVVIVFSIFFVRRFLVVPARSRNVDRVLFGVAAFTVMLYLANLTGLHFAVAPVLASIGLVVTVVYAAMGLAAARRGYRPARFFLIAFAVLLTGNVLYILMFLGVLPPTLLTYNAAQAGSAIECILLAFALADRMNVLKHERDEKQIEYTHDLKELVQRRTAELSDAVEQLKTASITDPLTGLSNRRHVDAAIQPWIAELQRARVRNVAGIPRRYLAICLGDLDHFKLVNDTLGHATGDKVLQAAAEILRQNVRATAILARWGGEEFLILDHVSGPYDDLLMAERLRLSITQDTLSVRLDAGSPLSLSLGVVRYPFSERYPDLLNCDH